MHTRIYKLWKIVSLATSIASLFFFSVFFYFMTRGYTVYLLEPNIVIAITEFFLCLSALIFIINSLHLKALITIFHYPLVSLGVIQYADVISTEANIYFKRPGHELNPTFYSPFALIIKLIIFPIGCVYLQFKVYNHLRKPTKISIQVILGLYFVVIINNLVGLFL